VGEIALLGPGMEASGMKVGERVLSEQIVPCNDCRYCKRGDYNMCIPHEIYGFRTVVPGAMATYMIFPKDSLTHKIPKSLDPFHAVFAEPLACAVHAVNRANVGLNDVVVVSGCGAIGIGAIATARMKNPAKIIALDLYNWKLQLGKDSGADVLLNPKQLDVVAKVKELSGGYGCDVYIEATGHPTSVVQGLAMIAKKGTFVEYSVFGEKVTCDWTTISDAKELDVKGGHLSPGTFQTAIRMLNEDCGVTE
jgi:threonine dehydrogenase-like Zn-dependent dehydrogenase